MTRPPVPATPAVADLLALAGQGDDRAWAEILRRYGDLVRGVTRSFRLQDADARDAEQRTWLRLLENLAAVRDPDRLGGWLATTASRECLRILREGRGTVVSGMDAVPAPVDDVEQRVVDADTAARLWDIIGGLPPRGRTVMRALFGGEARPYAEVSRITGIPVGSLGPTRARVLDQVRARFEAEPAPVG
ncbi:RNA polymerase sigma factor [Pseudonocardia humida]|uniref:Sigma-70 family RNA polymerase sigma factor n=1 Tax=Pseudonocardia humida TaxID=2800819 RepID=A0ABT0ZUU8_9PSEU|nr:sigma-70 family RNA polymerase sigma factor [Pseudonocardia humida]MCO1654455.1 sigma-70 family RNA polymerase sigma factor [Pseudonocardia humida]